MKIIVLKSNVLSSYVLYFVCSLVFPEDALQSNRSIRMTLEQKTLVRLVESVPASEWLPDLGLLQSFIADVVASESSLAPPAASQTSDHAPGAAGPASDSGAAASVLRRPYVLRLLRDFRAQVILAHMDRGADAVAAAVEAVTSAPDPWGAMSTVELQGMIRALGHLPQLMRAREKQDRAANVRIGQLLEEYSRERFIHVWRVFNESIIATTLSQLRSTLGASLQQRVETHPVSRAFPSASPAATASVSKALADRLRSESRATSGPVSAPPAKVAPPEKPALPTPVIVQARVRGREAASTRAESSTVAGRAPASNGTSWPHVAAAQIVASGGLSHDELRRLYDGSDPATQRALERIRAAREGARNRAASPRRPRQPAPAPPADTPLRSSAGTDDSSLLLGLSGDDVGPVGHLAAFMAHVGRADPHPSANRASKRMRPHAGDPEPLDFGSEPQEEGSVSSAAAASSPADAEPAGRVQMRMRYTADEDAAIISGLQLYGSGNWARILQDPVVGAPLRANHRTSVNIKDRYRTMRLAGRVIEV